MKRLILIICLLLIPGCNQNSNQEQIDLYSSFIKETKQYESKDISKNLPFDINVYLEKVIDEEITYRVIIDNPKEEIKNIKAIAIHNYETKDIYPTSGIFEKSLNLIPNVVDLSNNNVKGVILIGYIDYDDEIENFDGIIKVLIKYTGRKGTTEKVYYEYQK